MTTTKQVTLDMYEYRSLLRKEMALESLERFLNMDGVEITRENIASVCGFGLKGETNGITAEL